MATTQCPHCLRQITPRRTRLENVWHCAACEATFTMYPDEVEKAPARIMKPVANLLRKQPRRTQGPL